MKDFDLIRKAMTFATNAHEGQRDKNGHPYISHPAQLDESTRDRLIGKYAEDMRVFEAAA